MPAPLWHFFSDRIKSFTTYVSGRIFFQAYFLMFFSKLNYSTEDFNHLNLSHCSLRFWSEYQKISINILIVWFHYYLWHQSLASSKSSLSGIRYVVWSLLDLMNSLGHLRFLFWETSFAWQMIYPSLLNECFFIFLLHVNLDVPRLILRGQ